MRCDASGCYPVPPARVFEGHATSDGSWPAQIINPNLWQPLSIYNAKLGMNVTQKFTTPQWVNVTSFAMTCGTEFLAPAADIYQYGSLGYVAQARTCLLGQPRTFLCRGRAVFAGAVRLGTWHDPLCVREHARHEHASPALCHITGQQWTSSPCAARLVLTTQSVWQANEILAVSAALNDNKKVVVEYWADPTGSQTPPGHWSRICEFISQRDNHTLDDVRALAHTTYPTLALSVPGGALWGCAGGAVLAGAPVVLSNHGPPASSL